MTSIRSARPAARLFVLALGFGLLVGGPAALHAQEETADAEIRDLAVRVATATDDRYVWNDAAELIGHGDKATSFAVEALGDADITPLGRTALSSVLYDQGEYARASAELLKVAGSDANVAIRVEAVRLLGVVADDDDETVNALWDLLGEALDAKLRAALAKGIFELSPNLKAKQKLVELLESEELDTRVAGALALAEIRDFSPSVKKVLQRIRDEPTERGRLANALLQRHEYEMTTKRLLEAGAEEGPAPARGGVTGDGIRLVESTLAELRRRYVNPDEIDEAALWEGAARGIVAAVEDPHTTYQNVDDRADWTDHLTKEYGGIGAYVGFDEQGFFIITRPMFGSPAWKEDLKSGDRVLEVDGWPTGGEDLNAIVDRLRGPAGKTVEILVYRKSWAKPRKRQVVRGTIKVPTVYSTLLPASVGYILVDNFAAKTAEEFATALTQLQEAGARSLVVDFRFNGGGYLTTAVSIADFLLAPGKLVVETKGRAATGEGYKSRGYSTPWSRSVPLTVLVNGASASASEIVSGCLQKHGRARLVGLRTFGKGSVQNLFPIYAAPYAEPFEDANGNGRWDEGEAFKDRNGNGQFDAPAVKITIAKYYIGTKPGAYEFSPHREEMIVGGQRVFLGGVEPDVPVRVEELEGWRVEEMARLEEAGVVKEYFDKHFAIEGDKQKLLALARADTRVPADYPGFEAFYASLETQLTREDVWEWLHYRLRTQASNSIGELLVGDFIVDAQLQAAIQDLARNDASDQGILDAPEYGFLRDKVFETPETYGEDLESARPVRAR